MQERGNPEKSTDCSSTQNMEEGVVALFIISGKVLEHSKWAHYLSENYIHSSHYNISPTLLELMHFNKDEILGTYGESLMGYADHPFAFNIRFYSRLGREPIWSK